MRNGKVPGPLARPREEWLSQVRGRVKQLAPEFSQVDARDEPLRLLCGASELKYLKVGLTHGRTQGEKVTYIRYILLCIIFYIYLHVIYPYSTSSFYNTPY